MKNLFVSILMLAFTGIISAQDSTAVQENTIDRQFQSIIDESNSYKDYKVVKFNELQSLKKNTSDKIESLEKQIEASNQKIESQANTINKLNRQVNDLNNEVAEMQQAKDEISFLGMAVTKGKYRTIVWGIIIVLIIVLVVFIYKYQNSNRLTKEAQHNLAENEAEFEDYRTKALEKQQRLGRQLQDEKNKQNKNKA